MIIFCSAFAEQPMNIAGQIISNRVSNNNIQVRNEYTDFGESTYTNDQGIYELSVVGTTAKIKPLSTYITFSPSEKIVHSSTSDCNFNIVNAQLHFNGNFTVENSNYSDFSVALTINGITKNTTSTTSGNFSLPFTLAEIGDATQYEIVITNPDYRTKTSDGSFNYDLVENNNLGTVLNIQTSDLKPIIVNLTGPRFINIKDAVNYLSNHGGGTVNVGPGTYTGPRNKNISWAPFDANGNELHITIKGMQKNNCILDLENSGVGFLFDQGIEGMTDYNNADAIMNLTIKNGQQAIVVDSGTPVIDNNIIENCTTNYLFSQIGGPGITCHNSAPTISKNIIRNNIGHYDVNDQVYPHGGGIYLDNTTTNEAVIENNEIYNCKAWDGGAIYCTGSGKIVIEKNNIHDNQLYYCGTASGGNAQAISVVNCVNLEITRNLLIHNTCSYGHSVIYLNGSSSNNILVRNNTISNNTDMIGIDLYSIHSNVISIRNNIITNNKWGITRQFSTNPQIMYCDLWNNTSGNYNEFATPGEGCIEADPLLDTNYVPIWNHTTKSPCIDAGYNNNNNDIDPDNTRSDIGAKYYVHQDGYDNRIFYENDPGVPNSNRGDYINWVCFPVIDKILDNADLAPTVLGEPGLLATYPQIKLDYLEWKQYNGGSENGDHKIKYIDNDWQNNNHQFNYADGYKLKLMDHVGNFRYELSGQLAPEDTEIPLAQGWNWIGYFLKDSHDPFDALSPILDNISQIKHHDWALNKADNKWIGPSNYTINYGDMIMVYCDIPITFTYCNNGNNITPIKKGSSTLFTYTEQPDYTPIYIDMNSTSKSEQEIAIFVDGTCYGASKVDADTVQINAYLQNLDPNEEHDVQFVIRENGKSASKKINNYSVMNNITGKFNCESLDLSKGNDFYFVSFKDNPDNSEDVPPLKTELKNYPNPFKPSGATRGSGTTISFTIPESGNVKLNIYNVKGQLVKSLLNGKKEAGQHEIIWNGKNTNNESVASGIYFYRLETQSKSIYKKMLLVK
jgi:hypothetical protein